MTTCNANTASYPTPKEVDDSRRHAYAHVQSLAAAQLELSDFYDAALDEERAEMHETLAMAHREVASQILNLLPGIDAARSIHEVRRLQDALGMIKTRIDATYERVVGETATH